jgi:hypothetical protein
MATTNTSRLKALEAEGWSLVSKKAARIENLDDGLTRQLEGEYRLERLRPAGQAGVVNAFGHTIESALDAAEWEQKRLEELHGG